MRRSSTMSGSGGRPWGGPRSFYVLSAIVAATLSLASCSAHVGPDRPQPVRGGAFSDPLEIYGELGFMTGPAQFPVVASFSTFAGPADTTYVLLAVSIPNSALRFQREGTGFSAEYDVGLVFMRRDSVAVRRGQKRELVRVPSFNETGRTDESVVHQQAFTLEPGTYLVRLDVSDAHSSRGFNRTDTLHVPAYGGPGTAISSAVLVYEGEGRSERRPAPALIANPRHTVPYGGAAPRLYVESYGTERPLTRIRVLDGDGSVVWSDAVEWSHGGSVVRHAVIEIPAEVLPLGRFTIDVAAADGSVTRTPLVLTISDRWMVANFEDVLQFMRYVAGPAELDSLRTGSPADRRAKWEQFWAARDPLPITAMNEYRDAFFERVRYATEAFRETGRAGWNTDRGEVYIVLGAPDHAREATIGTAAAGSQPNAEEWVYQSVAGYGLRLIFQDRTGFGRYELVPSSAAAFRSAADRLRR